MEMESNQMTVVVTQGTTHFNGRYQTGYFFDFGDHIEYISLMEQKSAFERALALVDEGRSLSFKNCSLSSLYDAIQKVQCTLAEELVEKAEVLQSSLRASLYSK